MLWYVHTTRINIPQLGTILIMTILGFPWWTLQQSIPTFEVLNTWYYALTIARCDFGRHVTIMINIVEKTTIFITNNLKDEILRIKIDCDKWIMQKTFANVGPNNDSLGTNVGPNNDSHGTNVGPNNYFWVLKQKYDSLCITTSLEPS